MVRIATLLSLALMFSLSVMSGRVMAQEFRFHEEHVLGTSFDMLVVAQDEQAAEAAKTAALDEIRRLEHVLSTWIAGSDISQLNAGSGGAVTQELFDFLNACEDMRIKTSDAFSCRIGQVIDAWKVAQTSGIEPDDAALEALADSAANADLQFDADGPRVMRPDSVIFAVDGMAKGWIIDRAAATALAASDQVDGLVVNIGGDLKIAGTIPEKAVRIGLASPGAGDNELPAEIIQVTSGAVASSGGGKRDMMVGDHAYSHILSPQTGRPQTTIAVATVAAPTAAEADALATAFAVMGVPKSLGYADQHDGIDVMLITQGGARFTSQNWASLMAVVEPLSAADAGVENPWPQGFQLTIDYEIPVIDATNYEYPYVFMWVTDAEKKLVRSLLMLGDAPRWVEENHIFWRRVGRKRPALIDTVAGPSRAPGTYQFVWDGRDEAGRPVPQGGYVLHIEASRENGAHQYMRENLSLTGVAASVAMAAGKELGAVSITYGGDE